MEALQNIYTQEVTIKDRVIYVLKRKKENKAEMAREINYSRSAVTQYLNGRYGSNPTELESKLTAWLEENEPVYGSLCPEEGTGRSDVRWSGSGMALKKPQVYESVDYRSIIGLCRSCQDDMAMGIVVGASGYGKTYSLKQFAKMPRVAYLECDDTMACRDLVEAIEDKLGLPAVTGTIWKRVNRIRDFFNTNEGYLLIVDEADKLINKYTAKKMEILRGIFDQSEVGLVIAGEPKLEAEIKGGLARFANRMDFYYKCRGLNKSEVQEYLQGFEVEKDAMGELIRRAVNTKSGCFRLFDRTVSNVIRILKDKGETKVTLKVVSDASSMMML